MKYLIAGYGSIGRRHLRNLVSLGERDIILLRSRKGTLPEEELEGFQIETDLQKALDHRPDGVVIANPTALHLDVAIPAAEMGCSILMEKPISSSLENVDRFQQRLEASDGKVLMGYQFRFHPGLKKIKDLLSDGRIGRLLSFRVEWGDYLPGWHPWEDYRRGYSARADLGGGVVLTLCHPLDYLRWLVGEVTEIYASTGHISDLEIDVEDFAEILLAFENGTRGSIHLDYYRQPGVHRLEMVGSKGVITWDNADGTVRVLQPGVAEPVSYVPPEGFERNWLFLEEMRNFIEIVNGSGAPLCTLQDGIRAMQLVAAVYRSSAEKRALSGDEIYPEGR